MPAWPGPAEAGLAVPPEDLTEMGWGVEPQGLAWMLERFAGLYAGTPLMVMENGASYPDSVGSDGEVDDPERIDYLRSHIAAIHAACRSRAPVVGYFVWSLLDNFEWAFGYSKSFGIIHVDRSTMTRTIEASGRWYRDFLAH